MLRRTNVFALSAVLGIIMWPTIGQAQITKTVIVNNGDPNSTTEVRSDEVNPNISGILVSDKNIEIKCNGNLVITPGVLSSDKDLEIVCDGNLLSREIASSTLSSDKAIEIRSNGNLVSTCSGILSSDQDLEIKCDGNLVNRGTIRGRNITIKGSSFDNTRGRIEAIETSQNQTDGNFRPTGLSVGVTNPLISFAQTSKQIVSDESKNNGN